MRKDIARVLTVLSHNQREAIRKVVSAKRMPLDLRQKKTRALRRALSPKQARDPLLACKYALSLLLQR